MEIKLERYTQYFDFDKRRYLLILCLVNLLAVYTSNEILFTDDIYYQTYGERVAYERIERYLEMREKFQWIGYVFIPITLLIKISFVTVCLNVGTLFAGFKIGFKKLFKIVLVAEGMFVLTNVLRIMWLTFVVQPEVLQDIQYFYPLSIINFFNPASVEGWFIYPLITLNLIELTYFLTLALGLQWVLEKSYNSMLILVVSSYGVGLMIWMVFIVFLSINLS